eukprot:767866-Heterocapsa_arctica.AAC.1
MEGQREDPHDIELKEFNPNDIFACPPEHVEHEEEEAPAIIGDAPLIADPLPAFMGEGNDLDMFGGLGIEKTGKVKGVVVILLGGFTPSMLMAEVWWRVYSSNDRAKWWAEHKAKQREVTAINGEAPVPEAP